MVGFQDRCLKPLGHPPALIQGSEGRRAFQRNSRDGQISAAWNSTVRVAMHSGNQDRQEQEAASHLVWPAPFWIAPGTTRRQTQKDSRARGRRIPYIRMGGSNKWCSRRDLGGNVGTKYQWVCSAPVWAAVCNTASTCRILLFVIACTNATTLVSLSCKGSVHC